MKNANLMANGGAEVIFEIIKGKLLHQYKGEYYREKIKALISNEVYNQMDVVEAFIKAEMAAKYKHFIPVPTAKLKTRLKFLFTGELA